MGGVVLVAPSLGMSASGATFGVAAGSVVVVVLLLGKADASRDPWAATGIQMATGGDLKRALPDPVAVPNRFEALWYFLGLALGGVVVQFFL